MHMYHADSIQGSNQRSHLAKQHSIQPTFLQLPSCLSSVLICTSILSSYNCNWPLDYPSQPPLHRRRHRPQDPHAWTRRWPCTILYLRTSLPHSHSPITPSQHRYCRDPTSYSSFPPPLPGELGNPLPAALERALRRP